VSESREYFFVSDLHVGGDEQLKLLDFEEEFIAFLKSLEDGESNTELVIIGDAFGLWEFTTAEGAEKFDLLVTDHARLFEQLRITGEQVKITLIPGNHDYEKNRYRLRENRKGLSPRALATATTGRQEATTRRAGRYPEKNCH